MWGRIVKWFIGFIFSFFSYLTKSKFISSCRVSFINNRLQSLGKDVTVMNDVHFAGYKNISIGDDVYIGKGVFILAEMGKIKIGNNVLIAPGVKINSRNHNFSEKNTLISKQGYTYSNIEIEDDVWLAANVLILPGVTIGKGAVVAAGSVVVKDVAPYSVVGGVPARQLTSRK